MSNEQLYLAMGVPALINIGLITLLYLTLSRQIEQSTTSLRNEMNGQIGSLRSEMTAKFDAAHQALLRVEGVLDARLKHVEEAIEKR